MKKYKGRPVLKKYMMSLCLAGVCAILTGCANQQLEDGPERTDLPAEEGMESVSAVELTAEVLELEEGLSAVKYEGDYGFDSFLAEGGAASDGEVIDYLTTHVLENVDIGDLAEVFFGCSTIAVQDQEGNALFGRNFDWDTCQALVVEAHPENGYASICTANMDFITQNVGGVLEDAVLSMDHIQTVAALYAPLDGMNEKGLAVSVNMIQDSEAIEQNTGKPDLTTTTAIRLLLDKAADVEEAVALLSQYDLHSSMGMMVHFALADREGNSVAVEYINNEMQVIDTPVLTNFYLAAGEKSGIGTEQSHERYDLLAERISEMPRMSAEDVRDSLDLVSKDNFGEFESTEWSIVMDLTESKAWYFHREDYKTCYRFELKS